MDTILWKISLNTYTLSISVLTRFSQAYIYRFWDDCRVTLLVSNRLYRPPRKLREGNIIGSVSQSVCLSTRGVCDHYLWCIALHVTSLPVMRGIIFHSWNGTSSVFHKVQRLNVFGMEFLVSRNTSESKNGRYVMKLSLLVCTLWIGLNGCSVIYLEVGDNHRWCAHSIPTCYLKKNSNSLLCTLRWQECKNFVGASHLAKLSLPNISSLWDQTYLYLWRTIVLIDGNLVNIHMPRMSCLQVSCGNCGIEMDFKILSYSQY